MAGPCGYLIPSIAGTTTGKGDSDRAMEGARRGGREEQVELSCGLPW